MLACTGHSVLTWWVSLLLILEKSVLAFPSFLTLCPTRVVSSNPCFHLGWCLPVIASTSLMTSRPIRPADTGHLHLNVPWAPQIYLCHFKLVLFLIFSSTRYSAPCKTPGSHTGLYLPSLRLLMYFRMEWLSLIPKVSLTSSCLLIPHLLNQLLPLLPKQFLKKLVSVFCLLLVALGFPWLVVASLPSLILSSCGLFPSMSLCVLSSSHQSSYLETTLNPRGFQLEIHN